jgi:hypothetical protein
MSNFGYGWNPAQGAYNPYQNQYNGPVQNTHGGNYNPNRGPVQGNGQTKTKRNGAYKFVSKKDAKKHYIGGWFIDRYAGLVKVVVYETKHSATPHESKTGRKWVSLAAKVTFRNTGQVNTYSALLDVATGTVSIKDLNIGLNPAKNWCGFFFKKK